jgi:hypothetical protein
LNGSARRQVINLHRAAARIEQRPHNAEQFVSVERFDVLAISSRVIAPLACLDELTGSLALGVRKSITFLSVRRIFACAAEQAQSFEFDPDGNTGQSYLFIMLD